MFPSSEGAKMENEKQPEPEKQRRTPIMELSIGGVALKLTYANTTLFSFWNHYEDEADYSFMNHIWVDEEGQHFCAYDSPNTFKELETRGYPMVRLPYPDQNEIDQYVDFVMDGFDEEEIGDEEP